VVQDILVGATRVSALLLVSILGAAAQRSQNSATLSSASNSSKPETAAPDLTMQGCVTGQERYTFIRQAPGRCCNCLGLPLSLLRRGESWRKSRLANCRRNRVYRENYR